MGTKLNPSVNIWELARPLIEDWMRRHFGPRARLERAVEETLEGVRRVPRLVQTLEQLAERERRRGDIELARQRTVISRWSTLRPTWSGVLAALALLAAALAWWR
jgi:ubiquinone biosynthesis protein